MQPQKRTLQRRQNNEKQTCSVFYHYCVFSFTVHSPSLCLDWLYHTEPSSDPVQLHGTDARAKKRNVDRIYMYVGFISGYTYRIYYDNDLKVPILLTAAMDFFYNLAVYGFQFLLRGRMNLFIYLYRIIIPEIVYTVFLTVIVYRIFYYINHHFMTPVRKESESIWVLK